MRRQEPTRRFVLILLDADSSGETNRQPLHRVPVARFRADSIPTRRRFRVRLDSELRRAVPIIIAEPNRRRAVLKLDRSTQPSERRRAVRLDADRLRAAFAKFRQPTSRRARRRFLRPAEIDLVAKSLRQNRREIDRRARVAPLGARPEPTERLVLVRFDAPAFRVSAADQVRRLRAPKFRRLPEPTRRLRRILLDAVPVQITKRDVRRRRRETEFRRPQVKTRRRFRVRLRSVAPLTPIKPEITTRPRVRVRPAGKSLKPDRRPRETRRRLRFVPFDAAATVRERVPQDVQRERVARFRRLKRQANAPRLVRRRPRKSVEQRLRQLPARFDRPRRDRRLQRRQTVRPVDSNAVQPERKRPSPTVKLRRRKRSDVVRAVSFVRRSVRSFVVAAFLVRVEVVHLGRLSRCRKRIFSRRSLKSTQALKPFVAKPPRSSPTASSSLYRFQSSF